MCVILPGGWLYVPNLLSIVVVVVIVVVHVDCVSGAATSESELQWQPGWQ